MTTKVFVAVIVVSMILIFGVYYIAKQQERAAVAPMTEIATPPQGASGGVALAEKPRKARKTPQPTPAEPKSTNLTPSYPTIGTVERWHCEGEYHPQRGTNFGSCRLVAKTSYEASDGAGASAGDAGPGDAGAAASGDSGGGSGAGSGAGAGAGAGDGVGASGCR